MNELIKIDDRRALEVFSYENGVDEIIDKAREAVSSFEHDLSTEAGRKRTRSLGYKISQLKTRLDNLGKSLTEDWAKKKKAVDANRKSMRDQLDALKIEALMPVTEWQAEKDRADAIEAENKRLEELRIQVDHDHEIAILLNEKFDREQKEKAEAERIAEQQRLEELRIEREEREKKIAEAAARKAKEDAERERLNAIKREEEAKAKAAEAERQLIIARERAKIEKENARIREVEEKKKAAEEARIKEAARQQEIRDKEQAELLAREKNRKNVSIKRTEAKESLIKLGIDEQTAKTIVLAICNGKVSNVKINY